MAGCHIVSKCLLDDEKFDKLLEEKHIFLYMIPFEPIFGHHIGLLMEQIIE